VTRVAAGEGNTKDSRSQSQGLSLAHWATEKAETQWRGVHAGERDKGRGDTEAAKDKREGADRQGLNGEGDRTSGRHGGAQRYRARVVRRDSLTAQWQRTHEKWGGTRLLMGQIYRGSWRPVGHGDSRKWVGA
jgi:hypothetical protein